MSTRAQRRERAQNRRTADPIADRAAAAAAIYAQYDEASAAAAEEALNLTREIWSICDRKQAEAWRERCRKLGELEGRPVAQTEEEAAAAIAAAEAAELEEHKRAATDRLIGELRVPAGESIGAQQERADIEESGL